MPRSTAEWIGDAGVVDVCECAWVCDFYGNVLAIQILRVAVRRRSTGRPVLAVTIAKAASSTWTTV